MNDFSDSQARRMLVGAVLLGIAANALVAEGAAWRLGLSIWILIALLIAGWSVGIGSARDDSVAWPAVGGIGTLLVLGALSFVLRDAEALYALGFLSTLAAAALVAWRGRTATRPFARIRLTDLAVLPAQAVLSAALGAPLLAGHALRAGAGAEAGAKGRIGADTGLEAERGPAGVPRRTLTIVGAVIAVPVLFVLGALLVASDPVFEAVAVRWIDLPFEHALERAALIGFFTWVSAGWLRSFRRSIALPIPTPDLDALRPRAAFALLAPILYGVMLLLVLFLAIQARTLFGGAAYVELTSGLTYAQYAREGFVGLAAVAGIVLALLVLGAWLVADSDGRDASRFRASGWTLVGLVLVMLASSAHRLMLYMSFFGLTDARLYAAAFTVAVAAALAWAGFTVLRGRRSRTPRPSTVRSSPRSRVSCSRINGRMSDCAILSSPLSGGSLLLLDAQIAGTRRAPAVVVGGLEQVRGLREVRALQVAAVGVHGTAAGGIAPDRCARVVEHLRRACTSRRRGRPRARSSARCAPHSAGAARPAPGRRGCVRRHRRARGDAGRQRSAPKSAWPAPARQ
jgi:hypothetical protein